ncbi:hypothetical protein ABW19_dt0201696 [Dactylella cylindrospora]|nr:hypothetical protein ABW19_dt0201696 [Dactylella cylindrospora]
MATKLERKDFTVGWICAIPIELAAVLAILDEAYPQLKAVDGDTNIYHFGRIGEHNVVITCLSNYGTVKAGIAATWMHSTFKNLKFRLMVGVGGGMPSAKNDIRLGDIVVSQPTGTSGGVIQYDFGKATENGEFEPTGSLNAPPSILRGAIRVLESMAEAQLGEKISKIAQEKEEKDTRFSYPGQDKDRLFPADYMHIASDGRHSNTCKACDASQTINRSEREYDHPYIYYGIIASGNQVMKDGIKRDNISAQTNAICFEMEAAGLMDDFPSLVIRGICDYSDGHKNKQWQGYAALCAAIYAKELLQKVPAVCKAETESIGTESTKIQELNFDIPFDMPIPRNPTFVGREEEIGGIHEYFIGSKFTNTPTIFAMTGTGGMGKTQIVLEYAYRHHRDYGAVFWISAASNDSIRTSFTTTMQRIIREQARITWPESTPDHEALALKLGIAGSIDSQGNIIVDSETANNIQIALFRWLQLSSTKWLLIFDNADDLETVDLQKYLPNHGNGAILITSRRPEFSQIAEQEDLDGLEEESAVNLLLRLARISDPQEDTQTEAVALVKKMGFMPLAICQAGHYIQETKMALCEYSSHYEEAFMAVQSKQPKFGWNYRNDTAATTWEISFLAIETKDGEAARLLLTCSYLNPEEIFENLLADGTPAGIGRVNEMVRLLASYSLVRIVSRGVFSIHPVVHSWGRERQPMSMRVLFIQSAILSLGRASGSEEVWRKSSKWSVREEIRVFSHVEHLHKYCKPSSAEFSQYEAQILENENLLCATSFITYVMANRGKHKEAMEWDRRALSRASEILGEDNLFTLTRLTSIANGLSNQGKHIEALRLYGRVLGSHERILGENHLTTLNSVYQMAVEFTLLGEHKKVMELLGRALAGFEEALGKDDPATLEVVHRIAGLLREQGRYDKALQLYKRALDGYERSLGEKNPSTLHVVWEIGIAYRLQGKYNESMRWLERALSGGKESFGEYHKFTASVMMDIGLAFSKQANHDEAMQRLGRAFNIFEKNLGTDHPSTLHAVLSIGIEFADQGKPEAIQWFKQALSGFEKTLGMDHPDTLRAVHESGPSRPAAKQ